MDSVAVFGVLQMGSGETKELFPLGSKQAEPVIAPFKDGGFIIGRDDSSIFLDKDGTPAKKYPVKWSDIPISMGKFSAQHFIPVSCSPTR